MHGENLKLKEGDKFPLQKHSDVNYSIVTFTA